MRKFLYNVTAFADDETPISIRVNGKSTWPLHLQIGGGGDAVDVHMPRAAALRLREELDRALHIHDNEREN